MQNKRKKQNKLKAAITTIVIATIASGCSTTNKRDQKLIESLELQNATIEAVLSHKPKPNESICETSGLKKNALVAIHKSNEAVIDKLKPSKKKECNCGKNEKHHD